MQNIDTNNDQLKITLESYQRSEEVTEIIERMPTKFGLAITGIILFIFSLIGIFGVVTRYPDVIPGQIIVNTNTSPLKLVSYTNGKLKLCNVHSLDRVKDGQLIGYIENSTTPSNVDSIKRLLKEYDILIRDISMLQNYFPKNVSLGELNSKYYAFINAIQQYVNYKYDGAFEKQKENYRSILREQLGALQNTKKQLSIAQNSLQYVSKFYTRDSILYLKKVISEAELDKSEITYLSARDKVQNVHNAVIVGKQAIQETKSKIQQLHIEDPETEKQLRINVLSTYNDLNDNIGAWEQKYLFRAPFDGVLQFLKFYNQNQFIAVGENLFTIIPLDRIPYGQVTVPTKGAGKVKIGQEVIVKLDNFPYMEYGSVEGRVKTISVTTNTQKTQEGDVESYLVTVEFPRGLRTNYGSILDFKHEIKGTAEIITNDRKLLERLFDNLKYTLKR